MNNNTRPPTLTATIVQMPQGHLSKIRLAHHPNNPRGQTITLTLTVPIILEIMVNPDDLYLLKAA